MRITVIRLAGFCEWQIEEINDEKCSDCNVVGFWRVIRSVCL
jgi:hypothetical protein